MDKPNTVDVDYEPVEGVYTLDEGSYRKHIKTVPALTCENCSKRDGVEGVKMMRCRGCWTTAFCSKECAKAYWPKHKVECLTLQKAMELEELGRNVYQSPFLLHYLRVLLIFRLGLLAKPAPYECQVETVHLHLYPLWEKHIPPLALGLYNIDAEKTPGSAIPGRLHIGINPREPPMRLSVGSKENMTRPRSGDTMALRLWRQARKEADAAGRKTNPVVLVAFGYDTDQICVAVEITKDAFQTARSGTPTTSGVLPPSVPAPPTPWTYESARGIINKFIEEDTEDTLKLRKNLRKCDQEYLQRIFLA
ncbi:hypothetical protein BDZ97DRAFT_1924337 [Flammula alnicola]|nr:hypothetical protein BDZ97DRAFT_1924337 [Flammula alnicola]